MGARYRFLVRYTLILVDFIILNSGFFLAYIYNYSGIKGNGYNYVLIYLIAFVLSWSIIAYSLRLYSTKALSTVESIYRCTGKVIMVHIILITILLMSANGIFISINPLSLFVCYGVILVLFIASRFFITYIVEFIIKKSNLKRKIAIVGFNERARELADYFRRSKNVYSFEGYFSDEKNYEHHLVRNILAPVEECIDYAMEKGINEIYSTLLPGENKIVEEMLKKAENNCVRVKFVTDEPAGPEYDSWYMGGFHIIHHRKEPLEEIKNKIKKRIFDIIFSLLVIIFILSWLIPLIGILIKLDSKGPVFFIQKRSGRDNRVFGCIKFRSMKVSIEQDTRHTEKEDRRITKVGAFLRKNSLDELPQFLNVFKGDMSLSGPRPHMLAHTEKYSKVINAFMVRQLLKPGITGWAQVNGLRGEIEALGLMEKRVEYDIWYMENWSLMLDIKIVFYDYN